MDEEEIENKKVFVFFFFFFIFLMFLMKTTLRFEKNWLSFFFFLNILLNVDVEEFQKKVT